MNAIYSSGKFTYLLFFSIAFAFLFSCTPDEGPQFHYEVLPIESYEVPDSFVLGETYPILVRYNRPTTCHYFNNIFWDRNLNERTIAIQSLVEQRDNCFPVQESEMLIEKSFNFLVTTNGSYIFKFFKGFDVEENPIFEIVEIPVED